MKYSVEKKPSADMTALPAAFCGTALDNASALSVKALLALAATGGADSGELCERFSCDERELAAALDYWVDCGLMSRCAGKLTFEGSGTPTVTAKAPTPTAKAAADRLPIMSSAEASERLASSPELKFLLEQTANVFGRLLTQSETTHIVSMVEYTGLTPDIMLMLIEYCVLSEKKTLAYIKKVAADWAERGITTHEAVNAEIMRLGARNGYAAQVKAALRISDRALSGGECDYAAKWMGELGFDSQMLESAYEICIANTGKCDFRYIDRVLGNWKAQGIDTPEKIKQTAAERKKSANAKTLPVPDDDDFHKNALRRHSL